MYLTFYHFSTLSFYLEMGKRESYLSFVCCLNAAKSHFAYVVAVLRKKRLYNEIIYKELYKMVLLKDTNK